MLHLQRLSYFIALLDHGTLLGASHVLHVSQPALSRQIRLLETELSLKLFERVRGRLIPTSSALSLETIARDLLEQVYLAERATLMVSTGKVQHLLCVTTRTIVESLLVPFIRTLSLDDPVITSREFEHGGVEHALSEGADFGLFPLPPAPHLTSRVVAVLPISAVVAREHHWSMERRTTMCLSELENELIFVPPSSSLTRQKLDQSFRLERRAPRNQMVADVDTVRIALVANGRGVAVVAGEGFSDVWTMPIVDQEGRALSISIYAGWQPAHYAAASLDQISERMRLFLKDRSIRRVGG